MNFDDLQSAWDSDKGDDIPVPGNLERLKTVKTPVERIRRNMRNEFIGILLVFPFIGFYPYLLKLHSMFVVAYFIVYGIMITLSIFYVLKFYIFYTRLNTNALRSKDTLYEIYYDIKLHIELYKAFNYSLLPIVTVLVAIISANSHVQALGALTFSKIQIIAYILIFIIMIAGTIALTGWWAKHFYGKYLDQVGRVLQELKEE